MLGALEYILVPLIGLLAWHETRIFGERRDDRDWVEAAPVVAGVIVLAGYMVGGELVQPVQATGVYAEMSVWDVRRWTFTRAVTYGAFVTVGLVTLEAALDDEGYINQEWRLLKRGGRDSE